MHFFPNVILYYNNIIIRFIEVHGVLNEYGVVIAIRSILTFNKIVLQFSK